MRDGRHHPAANCHPEVNTLRVFLIGCSPKLQLRSNREAFVLPAVQDVMVRLRELLVREKLGLHYLAFCPPRVCFAGRSGSPILQVTMCLV